MEQTEAQITSDWKVLFLQLALKYGLPTLVAIGITGFLINEGRNLVKQLTTDLKTEQQFNRDVLTRVTEKAVGESAKSTEVIRQSIEQDEGRVKCQYPMQRKSGYLTRSSRSWRR